MLLLHAGAQTLTLSATGQTGTSGTNWSTSGTNPVSITVTGAATINTSVIESYLNTGISVIVNNTATGTAINSTISKTNGGAASLTIKDIGFIQTGANVTIGSSAGALHTTLWADADVSQGNDYILLAAGTTLTSNGGNIVLAGGADNGNNGGTIGDGIPDGFAWNTVNNTYGGINIGPITGTGTAISMESNGGNILLRGATSVSNLYPGITSQSAFKMVSGTGKISLFGQSTTGHGIEFTYGGAPSIAIRSASTQSPAIDIKGTTTASGRHGFWASNNAGGNILVESAAATGGGISIEGTSQSSTGVFIGTGGSALTTNILSQSGTINIKGKGTTDQSLIVYGDTYIGNRKDATPVQGITPSVTASAANILVQSNDQAQFSNTAGKNTTIRSTGTLGVEAYTTGYTGTIGWAGNLVTGSAFSSITLGKAVESYDISVNTALTATGDITAYANNFVLYDGVSLTSSASGNISINAKNNFVTTGTTRRSISTANGNISVLADADASGSGQLDIDYLTLNPGTGTTTLRCKTMLWETTYDSQKPYLNGTGAVVIEPSDASFQLVNSQWFLFDQDNNGMSGLRIGKSTNTGNIDISTALTVAGGIYLGGGVVTLSANMTSTATGDIFIKSNTLVNAGNSLYNNATIYKTAGTGTLTMQSQDRLSSGNIIASGTGVLNVVLWSDYANNNNGGISNTGGTITTNGGHLWIGGSSSNGGSYIWNGLTVGDGPSVGSINNNWNAMDFTSTVATGGGDVLIWAGDGYSSGINGIACYGAARAVNSGSGNITLIADVVGGTVSDGNNIILTCTGKLSLVPNGGSYPAAVTWSGTVDGSNFFDGTNSFDKVTINNFSSLGGLYIGSYAGLLSNGTPVVQGNTSNITSAMATTVAGPVALYGNALTISQNIASSNGGNIGLYTNSLSVAAGAIISSAGKLMIEPPAAATTIGLAGGAGTLAVTAANFNTNFTDGFSEIAIGNTATGNITLGAALSLKDNLRLTTGGNMALNEMLTLGSNHFRFIGNQIVPATGKYVKTNGTGRLQMDISNGSSKVFPVGTTYYNPVTLTNNTGVADMFYTSLSDGVYDDGSISGSLVWWPQRINLTWNIGNTSASTGAGTIDMKLGWNVLNTIGGALLSPKINNYTGTQWVRLTGSHTYDGGALTLSYSGYSGALSQFSIAENSILLPIQWLSFTGQKTPAGILLNWETASERNNAYFEVEKSADGNRFTAIGRVTATRYPAATNRYSFTDKQPAEAAVYYRLKQVDANGAASYSKVISFNSYTGQQFGIVAAPGMEQLTLSVPTTLTGKATASVYDNTGRVLIRQMVQAGQNVIQTGSLNSSGLYFIKVEQGQKMLYSDRFFQ